MKVGDKVKIKNYQDLDNPKVYTILELGDGCVKLKHPEIGGYFVFDIESIVEVISEDR